MKQFVIILLMITCSFLFTGCERRDEPTTSQNDASTRGEVMEGQAKSEGVITEIEEKSKERHEEQVKEEAVKAPPQIAKELWDLIHTENYPLNWKMWPGKEAFYKGTEPHGALLTTYVNPTGYGSLTRKEKKLPPGTIIVKENYSPDKTLDTIMVMFNLPGYDLDHGDWFWVKYTPDGNPMSMERDGKTTMLAGIVPFCIGCHGASTSGIDYIMTTPLGEESGNTSQ